MYQEYGREGVSECYDVTITLNISKHVFFAGFLPVIPVTDMYQEYGPGGVSERDDGGDEESAGPDRPGGGGPVQDV